MKREFKGMWIPRDIWLNNDLSWTEKLLLVEIDSLSSLEKGCFATNEYFAEFFSLSKDRMSKLITSLKNKGYIEVKMQYKKDSKQIEKRIITTLGYRRKQLEGLGENNFTPIGENNEDNNTVINNTITNTEKENIKKDDGYINNINNTNKENAKDVRGQIIELKDKLEKQFNKTIYPTDMDKMIVYSNQYNVNPLEIYNNSDYLRGLVELKPSLSMFFNEKTYKNMSQGSYVNKIKIEDKVVTKEAYYV